jgi:penicillin V acylase-like amidase (Ntn superfamily)
MSDYIKIGNSYLKKKLITGLTIYHDYIEIFYNKPSFEMGMINNKQYIINNPTTRFKFYKDIDYNIDELQSYLYSNFKLGVGD